MSHRRRARSHGASLEIGLSRPGTVFAPPGRLEVPMVDPLTALPERAARWLDATVSTAALDVRSVRLRMHGELKLKDRWRPFRATQWLDPHRGFDWQARVRMGPLWVSGYDRLIDGRGAMKWKLLGLIPVVDREGPDITRSDVGRVAGEAVWCPPALWPPRASWSVQGPDVLRAAWSIGEHAAAIDLHFDGDPLPHRVTTERWGDPGDQGFRLLPFGAEIEEYGTLSGLTVPTRVRVGWWPGTDRFEAEGEFFRGVVDALEPA